MAAARHRQWRQRPSLVVHVHVVGGKAMRAALTLMHVSTPVCPRAAVGRSADGQFLEGSLGGLILAVTHLITVGDVTIVEHFDHLPTFLYPIKPRSHYVWRRHNRAR